MIPLRDHQPGLRTPLVVVAIILVNVLVFLYQASLPKPRLDAFIEGYGMVPYEITNGVDVPPAGPRPIHVTLFTSMFMHGGWLHLAGNMLYLWVFGNNIEDRLRRGTFLLFFFLGGFGAAGVPLAAE